MSEAQCGPAAKAVSMRLIDTHVHLDGDAASWEDMMTRSAEAGVGAWIVVGGSEAMNTAARAAARRWPDKAFAAFGFDRHAADAGMGSASGRVTAILDEAAHENVRAVAIGEIGLDRHHEPRDDAAQYAMMAEQLALASQRVLPVIVHSRDADAATLSALEMHRANWSGEPDRIGVIHSFTGGLTFAQAAIRLGYHISFSGILTFRNAGGLRQVAASLPSDRILVETDTPYLAPVPVRGRPNEPAHLGHIVQVLAEARGEPVDAVAEQTARNARRLFLGS